MPKRTLQPNRRHRAKTHGFRSRMKTNAGAAVLSRRRAAGHREARLRQPRFIATDSSADFSMNVLSTFL